jgi:methylmalonyl-CoA/ethylmalonyl-CoA epimerase
MIKKIHHVGIVVESLARAYRFWRDALGLRLVREAEIADQGVHAALLAAGDSEIELLEPTRADTGVARFLAKHGEGLHHICFETPDIDAVLGALKAQNVALLDQTPRQGLAGRVAFLNPRACGGVLVELATPAHHDAPADSPVRFKRLVIGCRAAQDMTRSYQQLFGLPEVAMNDGPRSILGWVGGGTLLMVPAGEVGGTLGMAALSMVAPEMAPLVQRLQKVDAVMFSGASEITLKPETANKVHVHISRYHFP